jgi:hypothetical protein
MHVSFRQIKSLQDHRESENHPSRDAVHTSVAIATSASRTSVTRRSSTGMCTSGAGSGKAIIDSELAEPLDDEECDLVDETKSRIAQ